MSDNNPIDSYFKNSLEGHEVKASPEVWERVAAETESKSKRGVAWVFMRAAVVVLMVSVGTWYTAEYPITEIGVVVNPTTTVVDGKPNNATKGKEPTNKAATPADPSKASKQESEEETKRKKVIPIMKQRQRSAPIYVSQEFVPEVDESQLYSDEFELSTATLDPKEVSVYDQAKPGKVEDMNKPVTESAFYPDGAEVEEEADQDIKTKLYAYANSQFDNIKNGRKVELPRTGKPQLQINLNRIFNN